MVSCWRDRQQLAAERKLLVTMAGGREAVMADAVEAVRQGVKQEAADELEGVESHHLRFAVMAIILPAEADAAICQADEPRIGAGEAMRIATETSQHLLWSTEGRLGIDDPLDATDFGKATSEGGLLGESGEITEKAEIAGVEGGLEVFEEEPTEEPRQHAHRQEEAWPASDPACAPGLRRGRLERQAATGHDTMQVRVMMQVLSPGMKDRNDADLGAEMFGVGGDRAQCRGHCLEQDGVNCGLVLERDLGDRCRQCEDDMEIWDGQQLSLPGGEPLPSRRSLTLRTVSVAAGIVGAANEPA